MRDSEANKISSCPPRKSNSFCLTNNSYTESLKKLEPPQYFRPGYARAESEQSLFCSWWYNCRFLFIFVTITGRIRYDIRRFIFERCWRWELKSNMVQTIVIETEPVGLSPDFLTFSTLGSSCIEKSKTFRTTLP